MRTQIIKSSLMAIGIGFIVDQIQSHLQSTYLNEFLFTNLINLQIALLAVNSATIGIVLTKIRDLVEKHGNGDCFLNTKRQMLLSIKEQFSLIILAITIFTLAKSKIIPNFDNKDHLFNSIIIAIFAYSLTVLFDTAKSVIIIIDFKPE
jgi:hypothetical protein